MRAAARLFASVKQAKYLEPGAPTGLTGLRTHPSPRGALLFLYNATLDKLKEFPESSVYRQATESLTKHRLSIVESAVPAGYKEWIERVQYELDENPDAFEMDATSGAAALRLKYGKKDVDYRRSKAAWDGEKSPRYVEGPRPAVERQRVHAEMAGPKDYKIYNDVVKPITLPEEPQLTAEQYVLD
jgi:NADH dehydrogenase (ubiquinone) 1 alpha subcomplex subunit 5